MTRPQPTPHPNPTPTPMQLIDKLGGPSQVAEMTGRKARVVRDERGRGVYQLRAKVGGAGVDRAGVGQRTAVWASGAGMGGRQLGPAGQIQGGPGRRPFTRSWRATL